jgi:hypothetical protein
VNNRKRYLDKTPKAVASHFDQFFFKNQHLVQYTDIFAFNFEKLALQAMFL